MKRYWMALSRYLSYKNPIAWVYREATWQDRPLPDFIVIGAQKSGTSSLHAYLKQHPQIISAVKKEVHFFDGGLLPERDNFLKGQRWYRAHFPKKNKISSNQKVFEASPLYIFNPQVPKRIADLIPHVKLIAVLRNPTERAISHYFHERRKGRESLPIMDAMRAEEDRLKPILDRQDYKNRVFIHFSYKSRGRYSEQINRFINFFPLNQMLFLSSDELFTETHKALRRIFNFIDVDADFVIPDLQPRGISTNRTQVGEEVYKYLNDYFMPYNQDLYRIINYDFGWN